MSERLPSHLMVAALIRLAETEGGFAMVLAKGDADRGAIAVILMERGSGSRLFERQLQSDGTYAWQESAAGDGVAIQVERRRRFDPDLWVIELDIVDSERFAAEMTSVR